MADKYFNSHKIKHLFNSRISFFALIDEHSIIQKRAKIYQFVRIINSFISDYTYVASSSIIANAQIGKFCSIAKNVKIGMGVHPTNFISSSPIFYKKKNPLKENWVEKNMFIDTKPTIIGNDVWIGVDVIIMDGVTIGNGVIIGANAVVTKDIPSYAIVVGVPARIIRYRFQENICKQIEDSQWWNFPYSVLKKNIHLFSNDDFSINDIIHLNTHSK